MADETNAEGANAQAPEAPEGSQSSQSGAGVQARIDELTHFRRTAEADAAATRQLLASQQEETRRLQDRLAELANPPTREADVDYSQLGDAGAVVKQAVESAVKRTSETLTAQFNQQFRQLQSVQVQQSVASIAKQYGLPADVEAHAQSVMVGATQKGIPMIPEDAVKWAMGQALMEGKIQPASIRKPGPNGNVLTGPSPMPVHAAAQRQVAMPANFENLPPDQQDQWLAKAGVTDFSLD